VRPTPRPLLALCAALSVLAAGGCDPAPTHTPRSPLKVDHANGQTFVPYRTKRLVTLEDEALDDSLAYGVKPYAAATSNPNVRLPRYLSRRARGVRVLGPAWHLDLRKVAALHPDLMLGSKERDGSLYKRLTDIAPTVNTIRPGGDWKLNLRLYGEALQRPDVPERMLNDYDARVARLRRRVPHPDRTEVSVVRTTAGGVRAYPRFSFPGTILSDVGFARPPAQSSHVSVLDVVPDQIPSLDGDVIFLGRAPGDAATYRRLTVDPRWGRLHAVRTGHVVMVADDVWFVGQGVLASRLVIAQLGRTLGR
jgi:iron complex transport system substrate-binding protein